MRICIITPAPAHSRKGNRVTALRWAHILRSLGHRISIDQTFHGRPCDVLVALHARRSHESIIRCRQQYPHRPIILALTGTDLYRDIRSDAGAQESLEIATRFILLQPQGTEELPEHLRRKARVIYQSIPPPATNHFRPRSDRFEVCVVGHLREVKDPFRTAEAVRLLPAASRIRVVHVGGPLSEDMERRARSEQAANPRYQWLGELPRWKALRTMARCRLLSLTSEMEGGANVISEALAYSVPVISSHISGSVGLLGADYPGYFPFGDTQALAELLLRAENDSCFYDSLKTCCGQRKWLIDPALEAESWKGLLSEVMNSESLHDP